jgi:hypothetical protein
MAQRGQPANKRRRVRGGATMSTSTRGSEMVFDIADEAEQLHDLY